MDPQVPSTQTNSSNIQMFNTKSRQTRCSILSPKEVVLFWPHNTKEHQATTAILRGPPRLYPVMFLSLCAAED